MNLLTFELEKIVSHLTEYGGLRGSAYTIGSSAIGTFSSFGQINLLETCQIVSWMLSIVVGVLTIYGLLKKYIKEHKESKKDKPLES